MNLTQNILLGSLAFFSVLASVQWYIVEPAPQLATEPPATYAGLLDRWRDRDPRPPHVEPDLGDNKDNGRGGLLDRESRKDKRNRRFQRRDWALTLIWRTVGICVSGLVILATVVVGSYAFGWMKQRKIK